MAGTRKDTTAISEKGSFARSVPDEHNEATVPDEAVHIPGYDARLQFDPQDAQRALRKVDLLILPPIVLCFCFLQFDRSNIGNALTDSLRQDLHVGNAQVNLAQTLFTVGFVLTELPFNMISKRIGPERFLPVTMLLWGVVTWTQVFLRNAAGLYACRFLIGALEGGYIPGFALYISKFYTNQELAFRYSIFWAANGFAGALGGPLSIGLLSLGGRGGLAGWQWLFLVEGVLTCFLGVVAYLYLPHNAANPKSFFGKSWSVFTPREASILVTRVLRNDPTKALRHGRPVLPSHILETVSDWRLYGHLVAALLSMVMISPMNTYAPSIIKSLGFTSLQANGLNSVGSICALVWSVTLAYSSDRLQERGLHIAAGYLWGAVGLLWLALAPTSVAKWVLYGIKGGVVWTQMGMGSAQAISAAWLTSKMEDYKRPVALAAYVMSIQLANFPGNQLFRSQDAPRYKHGLLVAAACAIAATAVILVWKLLYRLFDEDSFDSDSSQSSPVQQRSGFRDKHHRANRACPDSRISKLERTVAALIDRLDAQSNEPGTATTVIRARSDQGAPVERNPAPVILIREAATDAGLSPPGQFGSLPGNASDVISAGLVTASTSHSLLKLFRIHYGRWVRFSKDTSLDRLLSKVRRSPLLLCSVLLIAVRHTTQELADELAPRLFHEAKSLAAKALLVVPQTVEHFQALLILSLWSTTVGQQPLSIDGWLLTGYALQQGFASACFPGQSKLRQGGNAEQSDVDAQCLWNHLCVAHLQYCVGTRRQTMLRQEHVDRCSLLVETGSLQNYEARMVAEVKLYWVMYTKCCPQSGEVDVRDCKVALRNWKTEWAGLFDEPRSHLLQMGFHFAHLLAYYHSARSPQSLTDASLILEMVDLAGTIMNLAMDTTDDRTRHLTDHIYHIITFSALTLCRLVQMYESQLRIANVDVDGLDRLVMRLVTWLRSIGLSCHVARLLSDVVSSQFQKLRPNGVPDEATADATMYSTIPVLDASPLPSNAGFYPDLIGSELFDMDEGITSWPQWS
ncbi:Major facilitator superfamily domain, general substrate transporter [Cordyceps fumosorosea ARSEF 2679]|uniref:Major facilitator superfamily domain, general substrate transporter n=1 Tax=Cordyceps fumosorosea (strain ARSEF 2679) TaxID=1081104 RepID=A0A167R2X1_CORFA|nr:Major facilitator superfamily domain, general substrate transporter [Cordyceps fumosorosea ARSEF 2679]OAA58224.1 Major facilitator superfamily domain, general substrate transporter [Cordyceps fumosorosea ARSEF 2679]